MSLKKQIFKRNVLERFINDEKSCVSLVPTIRLLALPPFFLNDMKSGILYILNSMLKKYDRSLGGIVIGYQNIRVLLDENTGIIPIGTSETEVNITVEFYIFQPKIGNYLEGVVNKKSNNHIGCLVHQYFNATILKPEDVEYKDWLCKDFNVDDKIIFKVKDLDFTGVLPYIEGVIDDETLSDKVKTKVNKNCSMSNVIINNVRSGFLSKDSIYGESVNVGENKNENISTSGMVLGETDSLVEFIKKKPKKKKEKLKFTLDDYWKVEQKKFTNDEGTSETVNNSKSKLDESHFEKKKQKKEKKKQKDDKGNNVQDVSESVVKEDAETLTHSILEKCQGPIEDENSSDFVKPIKNNKNKKRKKDEEPSAASKCLSSKEPEDNVFYSTLIEPMLSKKMRMPFFSPIAKRTSLDAKKHEINSATQHMDTLTDLNSQDEEEKKRKHKKRKREKEMEHDDVSASKKIKIFSNSPSKKEASEDSESEMHRMMEELYKEQLNRVKEELNMSGKETFVESKKKKEKKKQEVVEESLNKYTKAHVNGSVGTEEQTARELQKVKERLTMTDRESSKEDSKKKKKTSKAKEKMKSTKGQVNGLSGNEKSEPRNTMGELLQLELNKVKEELKMSNIEGKKEMTDKPETTHYSLYEKLLKQAKRVIDLKNDDSPSEKKKKKKSNDLELPSSSGKERIHRKQKTEHCHQTADRYKNGSMYDVTDTPEKVNFDKSLFTDSENSHTSPVKRKWTKEVNGIEGESLVQITLDDFRKEKSESDKESLKKKEKKRKSKLTIQGLGGPEESLYKKLLKEAKSLVESSPKKKKVQLVL